MEDRTNIMYENKTSFNWLLVLVLLFVDVGVRVGFNVSFSVGKLVLVSVLDSVVGGRLTIGTACANL